MGDRPKIECDVHDLLDEANVMLLMHAEPSPVTDDLIERLVYCSHQAALQGRTDISARLDRAAHLLRTKLVALPVSNRSTH